MTVRAVSFLALLLLAPLTHAHSVGESYLFLSVDDRVLEIEIQIRLEELGRVLTHAGLAEGEVDSDEVDASIEWLSAYLARGVSISTAAETYTFSYREHDYLDTAAGRFAQFVLTAQAAQPVPEVVQIDYGLVFEADPNHKALMLVRFSDKTNLTNFTEEVALHFDAQNHAGRMDLTEALHLEVLGYFIGKGAEHILEGIDHVLFLVALLLLAVVRRQDRSWTPVASFKPSFINIVKVVTLFTLAHTVTLSLAVLGFIELPSRLIEIIIAASVAFVAVNALYPMVSERIWFLVFGFGLFHGLGFASNLSFLGLAKGSLLYPLAGFNIGVELGQLAIICAVFPIAYWLSRKRYYVPGVLKPAATIVGAIALLWLTERTFDVSGLMPG